MSGVMSRRMQRLEHGSALALPFHLPLEQWTDEQLIGFVATGYPDVDMNVSDERLREIAEGRA
jgi:hypothetical protein